MKVDYKDNASLGPGNGILTFSECLPPDQPWSISIQRASDQNFMTGKKAKQWVGETFFMPLQGSVKPDGALELFIGPAIVDSLDQQEQYRVALKGKDGDVQKGRLKVGQISFSLSGSLDNTAQGPEIINQPEPEPPVNQPPLTDTPEPEPQTNTLEREPEPPVDKPESSALNEPLPMGDQPAQPAKKHLWRYIILALLAILCIAWFLLEKFYKGDEAQEPAQEPAKEEPAPKSEPPKEAPPAPEPPKSAEEQVRTFFNGKEYTPAEALALARTLPKNTPAEQDAIYRLYYFAGTHNEPDAMLEYAACVDPSKPNWGSIQKDGAMALGIYQDAQKHNVPGAEQAAAALRKWLEDQAAGGNAQAKVWLDQIQ